MYLCVAQKYVDKLIKRLFPHLDQEKISGNCLLRQHISLMVFQDIPH